MGGRGEGGCMRMGWLRVCGGGGLTAELSIETIRYIHGEDGNGWQVEGAGSDHHGQKQGPVYIALPTHVVVSSGATELVGKIRTEEHWYQCQRHYESYACREQ